MGREKYTKPNYWEQTKEKQHEELNGIGEMIMDQNCFEPELKVPTMVCADNKCSNLWTNENTTTEGNMYIRTSYFMTKEEIITTQRAPHCVFYDNTPSPATGREDPTPHGLGKPFQSTYPTDMEEQEPMEEDNVTVPDYDDLCVGAVL